MRNDAVVVDAEPMAGLADLFASHRIEILNFLRRRSGSQQIAEDLMSTVFEEASLRFRCGQGSDVTRAWLFTVARCRLIDHRRRAARQKNLGTKLQAEARSETATEDNEWITLIESVRPTYRRILVRRYVLGESVATIATTDGVTYRAAESMLARARVACRQAHSSEN